ncbi:hypothetical protein ACF0H5_021065 [Mactra antiquata]
MTEVMFAGRCLRELKQAVQELFDVLYDIITEPIVSYADLISKLSTVSAKRWDKVRSLYIQDETQEYCNGVDGDGNDDGAINVVKILLDFVALMSKCSQEVLKKVEERQQELKESDYRMKTMEEQIRKMEEVMESQKKFYTEKLSENNDLAARNMHLHNQIADKNKQIADLERTNNTQLWEREKQVLLKESSERISTLEKELQVLRLQNESSKQKISALEIQLKQYRLKSQVIQERSNSPALGENGEEKVKLSTINYMQDKDIVYLEKKLYDLQTSTVGVIGGMKTDFKQLAHKFIDPELGNVDEQFKVLSKRMDRIYKAMVDDDVEKAKEILPPHYRYLEDDNFKVKKIRRLSQPIISAPKRTPNCLDEKKPLLKPIPKIDEQPINPVIINPQTKQLHPINPLKYFPFMSQQFIKDQFEKFNRYDKNGNGSLDLQEMIDIVKELGFDFNIHQLEEAMEEVDRDGNKSLDFFEYMLIIDNIYRKQG